MNGYIKELNPEREGIYTLANEDVNGQPYWKHKSGKFCMWWDKETSYWMIGNTEDLGARIGSIFGPKGEDEFPNDLNSGWKFFDHRNSKEIELAPDGDIKFKVPRQMNDLI